MHTKTTIHQAVALATAFLLLNNLAGLGHLCAPKAACPGTGGTQQVGKNKTLPKAPGS